MTPSTGLHVQPPLDSLPCIDSTNRRIPVHTKCRNEATETMAIYAEASKKCKEQEASRQGDLFVVLRLITKYFP